MLILTVIYKSENRRRYSTRAMSSHVTLAELLAWAQENCREGEQVDSLSFSAETQHVEPRLVVFDVDHERLHDRVVLVLDVSVDEPTVQFRVLGGCQFGG